MENTHVNGQVGKTFQSAADKTEERLIDFAVRIVNLSASLPRTPAGKHVAGQILRSGTSPAPNYGEAGGAESHADFVHKLRIVLKELNETSIWLKIIARSRIAKKRTVGRDHPRELGVMQNLYGVAQNGWPRPKTTNLNHPK